MKVLKKKELSERLKALCNSDDHGGKYFGITSKILIYSANRVPEISDDIVNIDNALKWDLDGMLVV